MLAFQESNFTPRTTWCLVDSNPEMLDAAKTHFLHQTPATRFLLSSAESTPIHDYSMDGVLIGSAIHWMDRPALLQECLRILKPKAPLLIFEYQFPQFPENPTLSAWIKSQFNALWKAPQQKPRGKFEELLAPFLECPRMTLIPQAQVPMKMPMSPRALAGFLFSQSRYQHHEQSLLKREREPYRERVANKLNDLTQGKQWTGDFRLDFRLFLNDPQDSA